MKKYIYIVQVTRQLSIDIINNFAEQGHEIRLLTGIVESNYKPLHPAVKTKLFTRYNNKSNFGRLLTGTNFHLQVFFYLLFYGRKFELIFVTTPPSIVFLGLFFKRLRNQKYHLILWDLYPDVLINFKMITKDSLIARIWKNRNRKCFENASSIFTLGKSLSDAIRKYTSKSPVIIHNWTNTDFIKPLRKEENPFILEHKLQDKMVVMYSGNLGITHNIEAIVSAAEQLKNNSEIRFIIIGDGGKKEKIVSMIAQRQLSNILLLPYQDKIMLPYSLASADISVITLGEGAESVSVPSKTYYTLAAGSAVLAVAAASSELGVLVEKYDCGKIFSGEQVKQIADFISEMQTKKDKLDHYKMNAREASKFFTPENARVYYDVITKN